MGLNKKIQEIVEMNRQNIIRKTVWMFILGLIMITFGLTILINVSRIYENLVKHLIAVAPNSEAAKHWSKTGKPIPMYIYFFNWTNPEDIYDPNIKPKFEELGPYSFKEVKEKMNVTFHDNGTVSYSPTSIYFDDPDTKGNFSDVITSFNFVAYAAARQMKYANFVQKSLFSIYLSSVSSVYTRKTVRELLFEGYEDPLLNTIKMIPSFLTETAAPDRFGWLYGTNGSSGGNVFNMGITKDENYGRLYSWNYNPKNPFFNGTCANIRGTTAELFATNRERSEQYFFHYELCRSLVLRYEKDEEINGIEGYKYFLGPENFDNGTYFPENVCHCTGECLPVGVMNLSACRQGSPIFFSLPHFYQADPYYLNAVEGLNPSKDKHEFSMTLQPKTGVITNVFGRVQLNLFIEPDPYIWFYQQVPKVMFPVFWFQQSFRMQGDVAQKFKILLKLPDIMMGVSMTIICLGLVLGILAIYNFLRERRKKSVVILTSEDIPLRS